MIADTGTKAKRKQAEKRTTPAEDRELLQERRASTQQYLDRAAERHVQRMDERREAVEKELLGDHIEIIPLGRLRRHPSNRIIDASDPEIVDLANSIAEHGQLEPLRVRRLPDDDASGLPLYEIISGERRYTALVKVGTYAAKCIVTAADNATALAEVAVANAHRKDLNPIERAALMLQLMKPEAEGGAGMTREQAGHVFGLKSESGCKNALRLLQLPDAIKQMIIAGEIPERAARALVPYSAAPAVMQVIAEELTDERRREGSLYELATEPQPWFIREAMDEHTRPISSDVKHAYQWPISSQPCLFNHEEHADELQIVDLPCNLGWDQKLKRDKVEPRKFALNVKLWDELQAPFIEKLRKGKGAKEKTAKGAKATGEAAKLTPAELKAEEKRKAAEAEKRLDQFTSEWTQRLLRCAIAGRSHEDELVAKTIGWMTSCCNSWGGMSLRDCSEAALVECQLPLPRGSGMFDQLAVINKLPKKPHNPDSSTKSFDLLNAYWRLILWPVSQLIGDRAKKSRLTPAGELPDKMVNLNAGEVLELAAIAGVSVETAWQAGATESSDERRLIAVWLARHTTKQLQALAKQLGVTASAAKRDGLVAEILAAHKPGRPLPLPKRLAKAAK